MSITPGMFYKIKIIIMITYFILLFLCAAKKYDKFAISVELNVKPAKIMQVKNYLL